ncbi:hypothetical protein BDQ12DRAFT_679426, partial [Crucibulum laeve]
MRYQHFGHSNSQADPILVLCLILSTLPTGYHLPPQRNSHPRSSKSPPNPPQHHSKEFNPSND